MTQILLFDPLLPWPILAGLAGLVALSLGLAIWKRLSGWPLRALGALLVLGALMGPVRQTEERAPLNDIVLLVHDDSASQHLSDRRAQTQLALDQMRAQLAARPHTELRELRVQDGTGVGGTEMMTTLAQALANEPRGRVAGIIALSDGQVHDVDAAPDLPAPFHLLRTGRHGDWDRRLVVQKAPSFAIIGEPVTLTLRIEDQGEVPAHSGHAPLDIAIDGEPPQRFSLPIGIDFDLPLTLPHGGRNVIQFSVPTAANELTDRNNTALVQINGVRDRLRVLLVSGEPHPGGRTWRNLLKSDSAVDLVHFTILRPPEKQDGVPVDELSLIAFPTRELFLEKIHDFDLIIFDRYKRRGILPAIYLDNVANYVRTGGAVLVAAGPDFASADSIYRSPLAQILPAAPTARVIEDAYRPAITDLGARHPVTADLDDADIWGRWLRQIELDRPTGDIVMTGQDNRPLLILNRVEDGRVALLGSDHAWLWSRGYEGGGPQLELLRRLAHWMMKEPELEEDVLSAEANGQTMRILRRALRGDVGDVTVTLPDGSTAIVPLRETGAGRWEGQYSGPEIGLYRLQERDKTAVIGLGPAAPREFEETIATAEVLRPVIKSVNGGSLALEESIPTLRNVKPGRPAAGRGWIGLTPRGAYETLSITRAPLLPTWLLLSLICGCIVLGWMREGR